MGRFHHLDPKRLAIDIDRITGDSRELCTIYRRAPGESAESKKGQFWGRIANIGRQTTGLEQSLVAGNVTGSLWILRAPVGAPVLQHDDEIRSDSTRWRIVHVRALDNGQMAILSNIQ